LKIQGSKVLKKPKTKISEMDRTPTFSGKIKDKDQEDISYWAFEKTTAERLAESWRLHCMNHNIPTDYKMDKSKIKHTSVNRYLLLSCPLYYRI